MKIENPSGFHHLITIRIIQQHIQAILNLVPYSSSILSHDSTLNHVQLPYTSRANPLYLSLANNHVLDYNYQGYKDTVESLNANEINYAGVGEDQNEAMRPCIINFQDREGK